MKHVSSTKIACFVPIFCAAMAIAASAQNYSVIAKFNKSSGYGPNQPLIQGTNGNLYGSASLGGANGSRTFCEGGDQIYCGTAFEITPTSELSAIYNFCSRTNCADGGRPLNSLVLGANGNFYGTTFTGGGNDSRSCGGNNGCGTIFEMTPTGELTALYSFCSQPSCSDGEGAGALLLATDGNFYGIAGAGGVGNGDEGCPDGCGTIFKLSPTGQFTKLYDFCANGTCNGAQVPLSLMQATNGNFYGMTYYGGTGYGNIFELTPAGKVTQIYSFCSQTNCADGEYPTGRLLQAADGNLYGATTKGGQYQNGAIFKITPSGEFTTLYSFCSTLNSGGACADGASPSQGLIQATDGNFYGITLYGGNATAVLCSGSGCGTAFKITAAGELTTLYEFCAETSCADGAYPGGPLVQATNGTIYGVTGKGGRPGCVADGGCGVVYSFSTGLSPFAEANPNFGKVKQVITILGNNLTGTTSVTFNGTSATFKVISATYLKAEVPTGATTGTIQVTTPNGTLSSNVAFQVLP